MSTRAIYAIEAVTNFIFAPGKHLIAQLIHDLHERNNHLIGQSKDQDTTIANLNQKLNNALKEHAPLSVVTELRDTIAEKDALIDNQQSDIARIKEANDKLSQDYDYAKSEIARLESVNAFLKQDYDSANNIIKSLNNEINLFTARQEQLLDANKELNAHRSNQADDIRKLNNIIDSKSNELLHLRTDVANAYANADIDRLSELLDERNAELSALKKKKNPGVARHKVPGFKNLYVYGSPCTIDVLKVTLKAADDITRKMNKIATIVESMHKDA